MTMKIKVQHLMDATMVIRQIITEKRPLPQKGNYRLARMFDKLAREFDILNAKRDEMIKAYDYHHEDAKEWSVPPEHIPEFTKQWAELGAEEIEVDVEPIPLEQLCFADPDVQATIDATTLSEMEANLAAAGGASGLISDGLKWSFQGNY